MEYNETLQEELVRLSDELEEQTLRLRHEIHQCPELSFQEFQAVSCASFSEFTDL